MLTRIAKRRYTNNINKTIAMKPHIQFTCPKCGNHHLMLVEEAMHRSHIRSLQMDEHGRLSVSESTLTDDWSGATLGFRCAECRHPDSAGQGGMESFLWPTLEDVRNSGAIHCPEQPDAIVHKCMICFPDGRMEPVQVEVHHTAALNERERRIVLEREQAHGAILITLADPGIRAFSCPGWRRVRKHKITGNP